jgi:hypothetical protein
MAEVLQDTTNIHSMTILTDAERKRPHHSSTNASTSGVAQE